MTPLTVSTAGMPLIEVREEPLGYRSRQQRQAAVGSNALLAVEISGRAPALTGATGSALAVVLRNGRRIEVGRGFDASALEQLVRLLEVA